MHSSNNTFSIFHLNINSIFNKLADIHSIISTHKFDFISLNETKLDPSVPDSFYINEKYNIIRRDRGVGRGGGIMILVKNSYQIIHSYISDSFEIIHIMIEVSHSSHHFICCYKPPSASDVDFLEYLETLVLSINMNDSIFIIGDLNMDLLSHDGILLSDFMNRLSFRNFCLDPTRIASRTCKISNKISVSSTLLDVIMHNGSIISESRVIP